MKKVLHKMSCHLKAEILLNTVLIDKQLSISNCCSLNYQSSACL